MAQSSQPGPFSKTFSFGGLISYVPMGLMEKKPFSSPISAADLYGTKKWGAGARIELTFKRKFGVDLEGVYHGIGFYTVEDTADATTVKNTKGNYYDFPLSLRYNYFARTGFLSHMYVRAGVALRKVSNLKTDRSVTDNNGNTVNDTTGSPLTHGTVRGALAGVGFRFRDDFGIKITPEVRYTRWFADTFANPPIISKKDQLEVTFGITW